jgi:Icc-related predicted phosphoesterase
MDEEYVYDGVKFYGMPWTPHFCDWAFNAQRDEMDFVVFKNGGVKTYPLMETFTEMIPDDIDVLITHGPCAEILDSFPREYWHKPTKEVRSIDQSVGCEKLAERVREVKPDLHFFGHIHHSYGEKHLDGTSYYNCASLDEMYYFSNDPHRVSYEK